MKPVILARSRRRLSAALPRPAALARMGLGTMILAAGVHKLIAPLAWTAYVVDWLAPLLVVSPRTFMLVNGVLEIGFGVALVVDRLTAVSAAVAAVSLTVTTAYLAVVAATGGGLYADVMIRDIGLSGLAWAVLADALGE
jgi:uncharacterized membrane protein YphA (DoxX/SURF4 family)